MLLERVSVMAKCFRLLSFSRHGVGYACVCVVRFSVSVCVQVLEQQLLLVLLSIVCWRGIVC